MPCGSVEPINFNEYGMVYDTAGVLLPSCDASVCGGPQEQLRGGHILHHGDTAAYYERDGRPPCLWQSSSVKYSGYPPLPWKQDPPLPPICAMAIADTSHPSQPDNSHLLMPVELQISNLDQSIDAREMKKILLTFFREHVMVLHVSMLVQNDGNLAACLKVPTAQDAQYAISQLHRRKIGSKRIVISYVNHNQPSPAAKRSKVISLLQEVPGKKLPLFKFRELYERRYHETIGVSEMYNMRDIITVSDNSTGRMVVLNPEYKNISQLELSFDDPSGVSRFCSKHSSGPDSSIGWAERDSTISLPNVKLSLDELWESIPKLLNSHNGVVPIASLVDCYTADCSAVKEVADGVPFEHLVSCLPFVSIDTSGEGFKFLQWSDSIPPQDDLEDLARFVSPPLLGQLALFSRELVDLLKTFPHTRLPFSRFIPAYHHHFGRQCRVADYGFTKLADLLDALPHVVQVLGDGNKKIITLSHRAQVKRFSSDLIRVLKTQPAKLVFLSQFPSAYEKVIGKRWNVTDYGVTEMDDLLTEVNETTVLVTKDPTDVIIEIPKRDQTPDEVERTRQFGAEVVELLRHSPQCMMQFNRFIPAYHHHFGRQCRVSDYGFTKLIELFEALPDMVDVFDDEDGEKQVQLVEREKTRVLGDQISLLIKGAPGQGLTIDALNQVFTHYFGYSLKPDRYGHDTLLSLLNSLASYVKVSGDDKDALVNLVDRATALREMTRARGLLWAEKNCCAQLSDFLDMYRNKWGQLPDLKLLTTHLDKCITITQEGDKSIVQLEALHVFAKDLFTLLEEAGGRMLLTNFDGAYLAKFGVPCRPARYGFASLVALVQALSDLVLLKGRGARKLLLLASKDIGSDNNGFSKDIKDSEEALAIDYPTNKSDDEKEKLADREKKIQEEESCSKVTEEEEAAETNRSSVGQKKNIPNGIIKANSTQKNFEKKTVAVGKTAGLKSTHVKGKKKESKTDNSSSYSESSESLNQTKVVVETIRCTSVTATILDTAYTNRAQKQSEKSDVFEKICSKNSFQTNKSYHMFSSSQNSSFSGNFSQRHEASPFSPNFPWNGEGKRWGNGNYKPNTGRSHRNNNGRRQNGRNNVMHEPRKEFSSWLRSSSTAENKNSYAPNKPFSTDRKPINAQLNESNKDETAVQIRNHRRDLRSSWHDNYDSPRRESVSSSQQGGRAYEEWAHGEVIDGDGIPLGDGDYLARGHPGTPKEKRAPREGYRREQRWCRKLSNSYNGENVVPAPFCGPEGSVSAAVPIPSRGPAEPPSDVLASPSYDYQTCLPEGNGVQFMSVPPPQNYQSSSIMVGSPIAANGPGPSVVWGQLWSPQYAPHVLSSPISPGTHYVIPPGLSVSWGSVGPSPLSMPPAPPTSLLSPHPTISIHTLDHPTQLDYCGDQNLDQPPHDGQNPISPPVQVVSQSNSFMPSTSSYTLGSPSFTSSGVTANPSYLPEDSSFSSPLQPLYTIPPTSSDSYSSNIFPPFSSQLLSTSATLSSSPSLATCISPIINPDLGVEIAPPLPPCSSVASGFSLPPDSVPDGPHFTNKTVGSAVGASDANTQ